MRDTHRLPDYLDIGVASAVATVHRVRVRVLEDNQELAVLVEGGDVERSWLFHAHEVGAEVRLQRPVVLLAVLDDGQVFHFGRDVTESSAGGLAGPVTVAGSE